MASARERFLTTMLGSYVDRYFADRFAERAEQRREEATVRAEQRAIEASHAEEDRQRRRSEEDSAALTKTVSDFYMPGLTYPGKDANEDEDGHGKVSRALAEIGTGAFDRRMTALLASGKVIEAKDYVDGVVGAISGGARYLVDTRSSIVSNPAYSREDVNNGAAHKLVRAIDLATTHGFLDLEVTTLTGEKTTARDVLIGRSGVMDAGIAAACGEDAAKWIAGDTPLARAACVYAAANLPRSGADGNQAGKQAGASDAADVIRWLAAPHGPPDAGGNVQTNGDWFAGVCDTDAPRAFQDVVAAYRNDPGGTMAGLRLTTAVMGAKAAAPDGYYGYGAFEDARRSLDEFCKFAYDCNLSELSPTQRNFLESALEPALAEKHGTVGGQLSVTAGVDIDDPYVRNTYAQMASLQESLAANGLSLAKIIVRAGGDVGSTSTSSGKSWGDLASGVLRRAASGEPPFSAGDALGRLVMADVAGRRMFLPTARAAEHARAVGDARFGAAGHATGRDGSQSTVAGALGDVSPSGLGTDYLCAASRQAYVSTVLPLVARDGATMADVAARLADGNSAEAAAFEAELSRRLFGGVLPDDAAAGGVGARAAAATIRRAMAANSFQGVDVTEAISGRLAELGKAASDADAWIRHAWREAGGTDEGYGDDGNEQWADFKSVGSVRRAFAVRDATERERRALSDFSYYVCGAGVADGREVASCYRTLIDWRKEQFKESDMDASRVAFFYLTDAPAHLRQGGSHFGYSLTRFVDEIVRHGRVYDDDGNEFFGVRPAPDDGYGQARQFENKALHEKIEAAEKLDIEYEQAKRLAGLRGKGPGSGQSAIPTRDDE